MPLRAAVEVVERSGIRTDRREIIQAANTLVVRLSEDLVARVLIDKDGHRPGGEWFQREISIARHLSQRGAPVIPLHPDMEPVPHEHLGYTMNFWKFVQVIETKPDPLDVGRTLAECHRHLAGHEFGLPKLAILHETLAMVDRHERDGVMTEKDLKLLRHHLDSSIRRLNDAPMQALHGDAHFGNLMVTSDGVMWTDWEDAFLGPVEWDLASILWNARHLDEDHALADRIELGYQEAGGSMDRSLLETCYTARAAVMSAWYPVLYPGGGEERMRKLQMRMAWLADR